MLTKLKLYLYGIVAFLVTALGLSTKYFKDKADKEKKRRKAAESVKDHLEDVARADVEIEKKTTSRRAEAANEIKERGYSDLLAFPDRVRRDSDKTD